MFAFRSSKNFRGRRVPLSFKEDIEPHEILLDSLAQKKEREAGFSEKKLEVPLLKKILQGFFIFCSFAIFILFAKTFQLQVIEGENFSELSRENKFIIYQIEAERGVIYDRNFQQLVFNEPSFDLILEKGDLPLADAEKEKILEEVAQIIQKDLNTLKEEIEKSDSNQILIAENLEHQTLIMLESKQKEIPGFLIQNNVVRNYKDSEIFSHVLGYIGKIKSEEFKKNPDFYSISEYVGRAGVENFYEEVLRRNPGKLRVEKDAAGKIVSKEVISLPESGRSLVLWLDEDLQKKIYEELSKKLQAIGAKKAVAIAMDPKTGGILAMVSLPSFDNNLFQRGADPKAVQGLLNDNLQPLFNRVISGGYLTGSTIKPLNAAAALQEQIINPETQIYDPGFIEVPHQYNPEITYKFLDWAVHGWTDLRKAIAESCNVYFYTIGGGYGDQEGLGPTRIKKYLELFGWAEKTGVDLPGETIGFVPDKDWKKKNLNEGWWDGDTYNLSIGQGYLSITPIEVVRSFAAIANGGKLLQPKVVKEIVDKDKKVVEEIGPAIVRENFIDSENLQIVREGMRQAVTGANSLLASAVLLNSLPVSSAAKTGTAETSREGIYHNWVNVFAPYENPEIVLTIMIEDVSGVQAAVLPVARNVLEWYFTKEKK